MEPQSSDQQRAATAGQDAKMRKRASEMAQQGQYAGAANRATAAAAEWGPMTAHGLHHPIIGQRKKGSTAALLRRTRDFWAIYGKHRLDPVFREELMLAVAGADSSRQCSFAHREWARAEGVPEAELAALEGLGFDSLDERKWAAFGWAQAYARSELADAPAAADANFRQQFSAQEQADIELAARTMYWLNETSNSVDAFLSRLQRDRVRGSTVPSEVEALMLYAIAVPALIVLFSIKQRRNPISILRAMNPFFREFEARGPHTISGPGQNYSG